MGIQASRLAAFAFPNFAQDRKNTIRHLGQEVAARRSSHTRVGMLEERGQCRLAAACDPIEDLRDRIRDADGIPNPVGIMEGIAQCTCKL